MNYDAMSFEEIRANLVNYYKSLSEFSDVDFDGPAISMLMDTMSYVTHYNMVYASFSMNECFLDSAQMRNNIVSRAKQLNYIPRQMTAANAIIKITATPTVGLTPLEIPIAEGTRFSATVDGKTFIFVTKDAHSLTPNGDGTYSGEVKVYEGKSVNQSWVYNQANPQRYVIDQPNIDTSFLKVEIAPNSASTIRETWERAETLAQLDRRSKIYYLQEAFDGKVEIYFGDGILGAALTNGNVINIHAFTTSGEAANNIASFVMVDDIQDTIKASIQLETVQKASNGANVENIDSIKMVAPRAFQRQNRNVIVDDYSAHVLSEYGWIEALSSWGGEDNNPPQYGKVFLCIKPKGASAMTPSMKKTVENELKTMNIVGIVPEIVDPNIIYLRVATDVEYNKAATSRMANELKTLVKTTIENYFTQNLLDFQSSFKYSKAVSMIDACDPSILSTDMSLTMVQKFVPDAFVTKNYFYSFINPIKPGGFQSSVFINALNGDQYQIKDDGLGKITYYRNGSIHATNVGTIDYENGTILLNAFQYYVDSNTLIELFAVPQKKDIASKHNYLLVYDGSTVNLTESVIYERNV